MLYLQGKTETITCEQTGTQTSKHILRVYKQAATDSKDF
jgi:hypothetical protein